MWDYLGEMWERRQVKLCLLQTLRGLDIGKEGKRQPKQTVGNRSQNTILTEEFCRGRTSSLRKEDWGGLLCDETSSSSPSFHRSSHLSPAAVLGIPQHPRTALEDVERNSDGWAFHLWFRWTLCKVFVCVSSSRHLPLIGGAWFKRDPHWLPPWKNTSQWEHELLRIPMLWKCLVEWKRSCGSFMAILLLTSKQTQEWCFCKLRKFY